MKTTLFMMLLVAFLSSCASRAPRSVIVLPQNASALETLAAKEVRRYVYLRSGKLLPIVQADTLMAETDVILVTRKDRSLIKSLGNDVKNSAAALQDQAYLLKTVQDGGRTIALLCGGSDVGTLYAAYRFAEHLGVRFYLHGDVIPDEKIRFRLPHLNETRKPLFAVRGIQPFHDFPEGPDWWSADDYKAMISQLPKMGMNFIGLHTYPEGSVGPEPTVWIGTKDDLQQNGDVSFSYPARHFTTLNGTWGYQAKKTSDYSFGADQLFTQDAYGADYMKGMAPWPETADECNTLFNRSGDFFGDVFSYAKKLGVKTCVGTETPLVVPKTVRERLVKEGKNLQDWKIVQALYEGMFQWVKKNYPVDYYWLWTPENWTWGGNSDADIQNTRHDIDAAIAAANKVGAPFTLATCGWVLGPKKDRAMFDRFLPREMPMSCINRQVGFAPVDVNFARLQDRPKWAIPWLEDDPGLIIPQLWAGRMRRDAADALAYGCTGLIGIHWRTRILGPNLSALANAGWEQKAWNSNLGKPFQAPDFNRIEGSPGALFAVFSDTTLGDTIEDRIYRTLIYSMDNYYLNLDNGAYDVTLKFLEVHYKQRDKRFFGVKIQDKTVADKLDIFARAGYGRPLDLTFKNIQVTDKRLHLQFKKISDNPILAGIVIAKHTDNGLGQIVRKINCAGKRIDEYEADPSLALQGFDRPRDLPVNDFYADWVQAQFGQDVAAPMTALFSRLDGNSAVKDIGPREANLPRPADWRGGPGGVFPDPRSWEEVRQEYGFVDEIERLRPKIRGAGNLERFDYWLNQFRYLRAVGKFRCTLHRFNKAMEQVRAEQDPNARKKLVVETMLPIRREQMTELREIYKYLLNSISTTGGMGTVANWQHNIPMLIEKPGKELADILGEDLPQEMLPSRNYPGNERMIVPSARSVIESGEPFRLHIIFAGGRPESAGFYWKPLGEEQFKKMNLDHIARGVYSVALTPEQIAGDFEYYIKATGGAGETLFFPATAPDLNRTVVVMP